MFLFDLFRKKPAAAQAKPAAVSAPTTEIEPLDCPVCGGSAPFLDSLDFNKACSDSGAPAFEPAGRRIAYHLCSYCRFCFAPEMHAWAPAEFARLVYNADYVKADPDYTGVRPISLAGMVDRTFGPFKAGLRHLDYGSGSGILSQQLVEAGWNSQTYDPFVHTDVDPASLGQFDFITAFEVFEHVPDVNRLYDTLLSLLAPGGVIMYSTMLSDDAIAAGRPLDWWYASPRNGHISLFSSQTVAQLLVMRDLQGVSISANFHFMFRGEMPEWARKSLSPRST
jgi:SAM-dependent methyltransferase